MARDQKSKVVKGDVQRIYFNNIKSKAIGYCRLPGSRLTTVTKKSKGGVSLKEIKNKHSN